MMLTSECPTCQGTGYVRIKAEADTEVEVPEVEYRVCLCLARARARAAIDFFSELKDVKPEAQPKLNEALKKSLRIHGDWRQLQGHLAYVIARERIIQERRLDLWILSSGALRKAYLDAALPDLCRGRDLVIVRVSQTVNKLAGARVRRRCGSSRARPREP
jgi:hypothetical protein